MAAGGLLLKVNLPPAARAGASSKMFKFSESMTVNEAIEEICKTCKMFAPSEYYLFRPAKDGWLKNRFEPLSSSDFEPKETVLLLSRFQTVHLVLPDSTRPLILFDFELPLRDIFPYILSKCRAIGNPSRYSIRLKEKDITFEPSLSLIQQNVDPFYSTLFLEDDEKVFYSQASSSSSSTAVNLTAALSELVDVVRQGPLIKANRKKKLERRWFALSQGHFFYYRSQFDPHPAGVIPLAEFQIRTQIDPKKKLYQMELFSNELQSTAKRRSYLIRAPDERSFNDWLPLLQIETGKPILKFGEEDPSTQTKKVFGGKLEDACDPGKKIPYVVLDACKYLEERALKIEGIFRLSGSAPTIKQFAAAYDRGERVNFDNEPDPHNVSGVLKAYIREMEEPILTYEFYTDFLAADAAGRWDTSLKLGYLRTLVANLPIRNRETLSYLMGFLQKVAAHSNVNQMAFHNLATVFGPNLLKARGSNMLSLVSGTAFINSITHTMLEFYPIIFKGEELPPVQPFVEGERESPPAATAVYDFPGTNTLELPLKVGDLIYVFHKADGWSRGECSGQFGRFPSDYVKNISAVAMARSLKKQAYDRKMSAFVAAEQEERKKIDELKIQVAEATARLEQLKREAAQVNEQSDMTKQRIKTTTEPLSLGSFIESFLDCLISAQTEATTAAALGETLATEVGTLHKALLSQAAGAADPKKAKKTKGQDTSHIELVRDSLNNIQPKIQAEQQCRRQLGDHRKQLVSDLQTTVPLLAALGCKPADPSALPDILQQAQQRLSAFLPSSSSSASTSSSTLPTPSTSSGTLASNPTPLSPRKTGLQRSPSGKEKKSGKKKDKSTTKEKKSKSAPKKK